MTRFVDYSRAFYEGIEKTAVPKVREGKFVQITHGDDEYIVFSPKELCKYHSDIVEHFARGGGLTVSADRSGDAVEFDDSSWRIVGGGRMRIDEAGSNIDLGGSSQAYGSFERPGLKDKLARMGEFDGYKVDLVD